MNQKTAKIKAVKDEEGISVLIEGELLDLTALLGICIEKIAKGCDRLTPHDILMGIDYLFAQNLEKEKDDGKQDNHPTDPVN